MLDYGVGKSHKYYKKNHGGIRISDVLGAALYIAAVAAIIIAFGPASPYWGLSSGDGQAVDSIQEVEQSGLIWNTTQVYLTNDHGLANSNWDGTYTVDKNNKVLVEEIQAAMKTYDRFGNKQKYIVYYRTHHIVSPREFGTRAVITKIEKNLN